MPRRVFLSLQSGTIFFKFLERENSPKYYFSDNGILNLFLDKKESRLLENIVAITLFNRYGDGVFYLKGKSADVDFFVEDTGEAIQVSFSYDNISNDRETENLLRIAASFKEAKRFLIIKEHEEKELTLDGVKIEVIPCWKFLLSH